MLPCHRRFMAILSGQTTGSASVTGVVGVVSKPLLVSLSALGRPILWRMLRRLKMWSSKVGE
jgi:hypothetical protein